MAEDVDDIIPVALPKRGRPPKAGGPIPISVRMKTYRKRKAQAQAQAQGENGLMLSQALVASGILVGLVLRDRKRELPIHLTVMLDYPRYRSATESALRAWLADQKEHEDLLMEASIQAAEATLTWLKDRPLLDGGDFL